MTDLLGVLEEWQPQQQADAEGFFHFDLGERRVNWNKAAWVLRRLPQPEDWQEAARLRVRVRIPEPKPDLGLLIGLQRQGQCWYALSWACSLAQTENENTVCIADFVPAEWYAPQGESHCDASGYMDGSGITALAIGLCDPHGRGHVALQLEELQLLPALPSPARAWLRVHAAYLDVSGTQMVAPGVFGSFNLPAGHVARYRLGSSRRIEHSGLQAVYHAPEEGEAFVIHSLGDRVRPSPRLTHPDWQERSAAVGEELAQQALADGRHLVMEYWNEPYLNWANRNRANFIPSLYNYEQAREGEIARIAHDQVPVPHLRWTKVYQVPPWQWSSLRDWRRGRDAQGLLHSPVHAPPYKGMDAIYGGQWQASYHPDPELEEAAHYQASGPEGDLLLQVETPWHLYDESQFTHWSGSAMLPLYIEPAAACAAACKALDPAARVIVGWGNRPSEDHWAAWELLYRPTIDALIEHIDGICDHDYGGDPSKMAAVYELIDCYAMTRHQRHLTAWNTECAAATDPEAVGKASEQAAGADLRKCRWAMRKIVHLLATVPDKARNCAHFGYGGSWWSDTGEGVAMDCLRALRGRLIACESDQDGILAVAALDGTDPRCPRPADLGPGPELVIAVLNDGNRRQSIQIELSPLPGTSLGSIRHLRTDLQEQGQMRLIDSPYSDQQPPVLQLMPGEVQVLRCALAGSLSPLVLRHRHQYYASEILQQVDHMHPLVMSMRPSLPPGAQVQSLSLRLAVQHLAEQAAEVLIGGHSIPLPGRPGGENAARLLDLPLDPSLLQEEMTCTLRLRDPGRPAFFLVCASLLVDVETCQTDSA